MSDQSLGLDIGYGYTKSFNLEGRTCFQTAVRALDGHPAGKTGIVVEVNGTAYLVGDTSLDRTSWDIGTPAESFTGSPEWIAALCGGIIRHGFQLVSIDKPSIGLGIPVSEYSDEFVSSLTEKLSSSKIVYDGEDFPLAKVNFYITKLGLVSYLAYYPDEIAKTYRGVMILDIGYRNINVVFLRDHLFVEDSSRTIPMGTASLFREIRDMVEMEYGVSIDRSDVIALMKDQELVIDGKEILTWEVPLVNSYKKKLKKLVKKLTKSFNPELGPYKILLAGGGSMLLSQNTCSGFEVIPEPQMANARALWSNARVFMDTDEEMVRTLKALLSNAPHRGA